MTYHKISFSQFGDMFPRAAKEPALAIWQSCGVPGLKKLLRMNLLQDQGIKANRYIYGSGWSGHAKVILSAVQLIVLRKVLLRLKSEHKKKIRPALQIRGQAWPSCPESPGPGKSDAARTCQPSKTTGDHWVRPLGQKVHKSITACSCIFQPRGIWWPHQHRLPCTKPGRDDTRQFGVHPRDDCVGICVSLWI